MIYIVANNNGQFFSRIFNVCYNITSTINAVLIILLFMNRIFFPYKYVINNSTQITYLCLDQRSSPRIKYYFTRAKYYF